MFNKTQTLFKITQLHPIPNRLTKLYRWVDVNAFFHFLPSIFYFNINGEELFGICSCIDSALLFSLMKKAELITKINFNKKSLDLQREDKIKRRYHEEEFIKIQFSNSNYVFNILAYNSWAMFLAFDIYQFIKIC